MIRIAIIDSQTEYGKKLSRILACQQDFKVIGLGKDGYEALRIVDVHKPDIVVLDNDLPYVDGVTAAALIKSRSPSTAVIILSRLDDLHILDAFSSGVSGYVTRTTSPDFLSQSIRTVYYGGSLLSPEIAAHASRLFSDFVHEQTALTSRPLPKLPKNVSVKELQVMGCLGRGLTNREIADTLKLREGTVRNYISSVLQKTGLRDRTQIALFSLTHGL